jgi:hypothetical protein
MNTFKKSLNKSIFGLVGGILIVSNLLTGHAFAATGSMSLSSSTSSVQIGNNIVVSVSTAISTEVDFLVAYVTYNPSQLSLQGAPDRSGNDYGSDAPPPDASATGSGYVKIGGYSAVHTSTGQTIAKLTFKTLTTGTVSVALDKSQSALYDTGNANILSTVSNTSFSVTAVPITPPNDPPNNPPTTTTTTTTTTAPPAGGSTPKTAAPAPTANKPVTTTPSAAAPAPQSPTPTPVPQTIDVKPVAAKSSHAGLVKIGLSIGGGLAAVVALLVGLRFMMAQKRKSMLYSGVPYTTMGTPVGSTPPASTMPTETQKVFDEIPTNTPAPATVVQPNSSGAAPAGTPVDPPAPGSVVQPPK